jgi:SOS-response transcriptional repressor LexA
MPQMPNLTPRKKQILDFIKRYHDGFGYMPILDDIRSGIGVKSISTVHEHLVDLQRMGYIHRNMNDSRSIRLLSDPEEKIRTKILKARRDSMDLNNILDLASFGRRVNKILNEI